MLEKEHSQYDSFTVAGHWWLPGQTTKVAGELHHENGKLKLSLFGAFHKAKGLIPFQYEPEEQQVDVIHGESFSSQRITAFKAFYTSYRAASQGLRPMESADMNSSTLHVHAVLVGNHVKSMVEQRYTKCRVQFRNLEGWLGDFPFKFSDRKKGGWRMEYVRPKDREYRLPGPFNRLQIKSSACSSGMPPVNRYEMVHRANVLLEPSEPQSMTWYAGVVGELQQLFTLLAGKIIQSEREWLSTPEDGDGSLLYYNRHSVDQTEDYGPIDFLFRCSDIEEHLSSILSIWLTQRDKIQHALNIFFSSLREPGPFIENRFLPMTQALEVYARADEEQTYIDPQEYTKILPRVKSAIPTDIDKALRLAILRKLDYANEYSLRTRLKRLIATFEPETVRLFCLDAKSFVDGVVDTRNYLTHYSGPSCRVLRGGDIHWATVKLRTMFSLILLKWIGLPETLIRKGAEADCSLGRERREWADASESGTLNRE